MSRAAVASADAPKALGPYSQAQVVQFGAARFCYTAGQVGLDPKSGQLVEGIGPQTKQVLANLDAVLSRPASRSRTRSRPPSSSPTWPSSTR
jgi:2-iminobutanoate/2-iminopropanoate deaminase